jgi:peptide/nickel transport system permease protein
LLSALRPRSVLDRFATVFVLIGISAHPVWIGLILSYVFGEKLGLAPVGGYCDLVSPTTSCGGPLQWAWHLWLPWLTFALMFAAIYMRMVRASVLEALGEDYVRTARAKGINETAVLLRHALRNAAVPVITVIGTGFALLISGVVVTESVFNLPGIGRLTVDAVLARDYPVIQAMILLTSLIYVTVNLLIDVAYTLLDPRIRY